MSLPSDQRSPRPDPTAVAAQFVEFRRTGDRALRNDLVEAHLYTVDYFVKRYGRRGVADDDLRQVGFVALINAVERFDPTIGVGFGTFASRTIEGELKRYFRDRTWSVRPPRRAQELHLALRRADDDLTQRLKRPPTVAELAEEVADSVDHVLEALEAGGAHQAASLDQPAGPSDDMGPIGERLLGTVDPAFGDVDEQLIVRELLAGLPPREREVMRLRFYENLSQPEIAARMDVSQSYLSRIIRRTLVELRARLEEPVPDADDLVIDEG
jgi:RNA polymerase sigma-B factor